MKQSWTVQDSKRLSKMYAEASWPELLAAFPLLSQQQIIDRARYRRLRRVSRSKIPWSPEEDAVLHRDFYTVPVKELKKRLGRTMLSIYARARRLGMSRLADRRAENESVAAHHKKMIKKYFGTTE
jgi:hypothetical protein